MAPPSYELAVTTALPRMDAQIGHLVGTQNAPPACDTGDGLPPPLPQPQPSAAAVAAGDGAAAEPPAQRA